jgi:phosphate:Na+ symporter
LGLFLFGLNIFEESIKNISTRNFKLFLRKYTDTKFKAILSGTFATTILQSSSVVGLILLAFVGAGFIPLQNAV